MRATLLALAMALCLIRPAGAVFQFDIRVVDLVANVDCWSGPDWSASGWIHLVNVEDPAEGYTIACAVSLGSQPPTYHFTADADELLGCPNPDRFFRVDGQHADFVSSNLQFELSGAMESPYLCGAAVPVRLQPGPTECAYLGYWPSWDHEHYPEGVVTVDEDFILPWGWTLPIEAGMEIVAQPGVSIRILGNLDVEGTTLDWVTFHGEGWDGLRFDAGSTAQFSHCRITGVDSPDDGGALTVGTGAVVHLDHCLIDHNATAGVGGAARIASGGALIIYRSTVSHNTGGSSGGVHLAGSSAYFESNMSLITLNEPANSEVTGTGVANVLFTDVFPQLANFPPGMAIPTLRCDPGFVDAAGEDFHLSYWSPQDPAQVNCCIDVSEVDLDPDGTRGDLGAFPVDQAELLSPPRELGVADRPDDNGGFVLLSFQASPNDGGVFNPVTLYSLWERQPGMEPGQWLAVGSVAALNDAETVYTVQVPTLDDQWEGHENLHAFRVAAHSVVFNPPAFTAELTGFSLDNTAPPAPTGLFLAQTGLTPELACFTLTLDTCPANDFDHYELRASTSDQLGGADVVYQGGGPSPAWCMPIGALQNRDTLFVWARAVDVHANAGPFTRVTTIAYTQLPPPTMLTVVDRPNDQGRVVIVSFHASQNDGDPLLPLSYYTIWEHAPGMPPGEWLEMATVEIMEDPNFTYHVEVPTQDDAWPGHGNLHTFRVSATYETIDQSVFTSVVSGFSQDNLAPAALANLDASGSWYWNEEPHALDRLDISWDPSDAPDFDHYVLRYAINSSNYGTALPVAGYEGQANAATFTSLHSTLHNGDIVHFWARAVDLHLNNGPLAETQREFFDDAVSALPTAWELGQNCPNPFNPGTRIAFSLLQGGPVRLSVHNLRGDLVATLVDGPRPAGRHSVTFDGGALASGVYFYRLEAPGFSDLKKMVLVK